MPSFRSQDPTYLDQRIAAYRRSQKQRRPTEPAAISDVSMSGPVVSPVLQGAPPLLPATASRAMKIRPAGYLSNTEPGSPFSEAQSQGTFNNASDIFGDLPPTQAQLSEWFVETPPPLGVAESQEHPGGTHP